MKTCKRCKTAKPDTEWYRHPRNANGLSSYCRPCSNDYHKEWISKNKDRDRLQVKARRLRMKVAVFSHYSGGTPKCRCCGESELAFLAIDHMNNDGASHRRSGGKEGIGMWTWLKKNGFPDVFQVLCMNCNWAKFAHGGCPHQVKHVAIV